MKIVKEGTIRIDADLTVYVSDFTVDMEGETQTGHEVLARHAEDRIILTADKIIKERKSAELGKP
jgi:hypothetical protein